MDIALKVREIIAKNLDRDVNDVRPESTIVDDLGADSLAIVELLLTFEEQFEMDIPDEETEKIRTVQDAIDYVQQHAAKR